MVDISVVPPEIQARVVIGGRGRGPGQVVATPGGPNVHLGIGIHLGGPVMHERVIVRERVHHHKVKHHKVKHHKVKHHKVKHFRGN